MEETKKLRMQYVPTKLVDFQYILEHTVLSSEVRNTFYTLPHKPLANQGRFGSQKDLSKNLSEEN